MLEKGNHESQCAICCSYIPSLLYTNENSFNISPTSWIMYILKRYPLSGRMWIILVKKLEDGFANLETEPAICRFCLNVQLIFCKLTEALFYCDVKVLQRISSEE
jgi:hypothetical protein